MAVLLGYGVLQLQGRRAGSTADERRAALPGDTLIPRPQLVTNHAITIGVPPQDVWPWLTQMGWHLGGWYTPRWVDRLLFPQNRPSLDHLDPALVRDLRPGDVVPDGPSGTAWLVVDRADPPHALVLHSTTHLPPGRRESYGAEIDWTWSLILTAAPSRRTRLQLRLRGRAAPWWFAAAYQAAIVPADYVMAGGMLAASSDAPSAPGARAHPRRAARDLTRNPTAVEGRHRSRRRPA